MLNNYLGVSYKDPTNLGMAGSPFKAALQESKASDIQLSFGIENPSAAGNLLESEIKSKKLANFSLQFCSVFSLSLSSFFTTKLEAVLTNVHVMWLNSYEN